MANQRIPAHESGIHQEGLLKSRETYEIMRAEGRRLGMGFNLYPALSATGPALVTLAVALVLLRRVP